MVMKIPHCTQDTVNTLIKETEFFTFGSEFLNKIHHFYQGKRYRLPRKGHFFVYLK